MTAAPDRWTTRFWVTMGIAGTLLIFAAANGHLLYVALKARPGCVEHVRTPDQTRPGLYRAAKSAC